MGGIGASATESCAVGDTLGQGDVVGARQAAFFFKKAEGARDEIGFIGRDAGAVAVEGIGVCRGELEFVTEARDGEDEGFEAVEAVFAFSGDTEGEVDFSGGEGDHGRFEIWTGKLECLRGPCELQTSPEMVPRRASMRPVFPFSMR